MDERLATVSGAAATATLMGSGAAPGLHMSALEGWYGTPDGKWSLTERQLADGAFGLSPEQVTYSSRTVTIDGFALGRSRQEVLALLGLLRSLAHQVVTLSVRDGGAETFARGALSLEAGKKWSPTIATFTLTVVCPDPCRYGAALRRAYLRPGTGAGGLEWGRDAPHGLLWPLSYGGGGAVANVATLRNEGSGVAYPVITASGDMGGLAITEVGTGRQVALDGAIGTEPVTLDCRSRRATVAGVDASRRLSARAFPSIPARGSATLALTAEGTGTVEVAWRDTYI